MTTKLFKIISIGIFAIVVLIFGRYLVNRFSYSNVLQFYSIPFENTTQLKIGIIGDSWVAGEKLDSIVHNRLLLNGYDNEVISSGHPGAKSKLIYENLFKEINEEYSSKFIIQNKPQYCIIIAGVNDAIGQVGPKFYSNHIEMIINTLLYYKIKPILVELPEFNIAKTTNELNFVKRLKNTIFAIFTNSGKIDNIAAYRKYTDVNLNFQNLKDSIIFIDYDLVCSDYSECSELYKNPSHLSKQGNIFLGQLIVDELISDLKTNDLER